tara:strand:+ start:219 stop:530 length:312 start_codon:yes stop_codon:yes gene_type:complete
MAKKDKLRNIVKDWAEGVYHRMCLAASSPAHRLDKDELELYKFLESWGWFELFPFENGGTGEDATRLMLAMHRYQKLSSQRKEDKKKPSKWEVVQKRLKEKGL